MREEGVSDVVGTLLTLVFGSLLVVGTLYMLTFQAEDEADRRTDAQLVSEAGQFDDLLESWLFASDATWNTTLELTDFRTLRSDGTRWFLEDRGFSQGIRLVNQYDTCAFQEKGRIFQVHHAEGPVLVDGVSCGSTGNYVLFIEVRQ